MSPLLQLQVVQCKDRCIASCLGKEVVNSRPQDWISGSGLPHHKPTQGAAAQSLYLKNESWTLLDQGEPGTKSQNMHCLSNTFFFFCMTVSFPLNASCPPTYVRKHGYIFQVQDL